MWVIPGSRISRLAIFWIVRSGTSVAFEISGHWPFASCRRLTTKSCIESDMAADSIPTFGFRQPGYGWPTAVPSLPVAKTKTTKPVSSSARHLRAVVAENVAALLELEFPLSQFPTVSAQQQRLARAAGCSWSTIQRILDEGTGTRIDSIADIAAVFGVKPSELMLSGFGRQRVKSTSPAGNATLERRPGRAAATG